MNTSQLFPARIILGKCSDKEFLSVFILTIFKYCQIVSSEIIYSDDFSNGILRMLFTIEFVGRKVPIGNTLLKNYNEGKAESVDVVYKDWCWWWHVCGQWLYQLHHNPLVTPTYQYQTNINITRHTNNTQYHSPHPHLLIHYLWDQLWQAEQQQDINQAGGSW